MNPANVRALRRSLRRVDSFNRLVKSVHKSLPVLAAAPRGPLVRKKGRR